MPGCARTEKRRKIVNHVIQSLIYVTMITMALTPCPCSRDKPLGHGLRPRTTC